MDASAGVLPVPVTQPLAKQTLFCYRVLRTSPPPNARLLFDITESSQNPTRFSSNVIGKELRGDPSFPGCP